MKCVENVLDTKEILVSTLKTIFWFKFKRQEYVPYIFKRWYCNFWKSRRCENGTECVIMVNRNDGTFKRVLKNKMVSYSTIKFWI